MISQYEELSYCTPSHKQNNWSLKINIDTSPFMRNTDKIVLEKDELPHRHKWHLIAKAVTGV